MVQEAQQVITDRLDKSSLMAALLTSLHHTKKTKLIQENYQMMKLNF